MEEIFTKILCNFVIILEISLLSSDPYKRRNNHTLQKPEEINKDVLSDKDGQKKVYYFILETFLAVAEAYCFLRFIIVCYPNGF